MPGRKLVMNFEAGSIVRARRREWIVQPGSTDDLLLLAPLGGASSDQTGIFTPLEKVESAYFELPDPALPGDWQSCRMLQDAMLLGFRNTAGPFRSFGHIQVDPRPYQFVPLILAMRMDPVRMLLADDVGIGKTVEALLIARELMDRGEAKGITVICPPHLAEQWQAEMQDKFHIQSELVLGSTAKRLERDIGYDRSLFDVYPNTVVSLDYIKDPRRRDEFRRSCGDLVIVDEAHTCTEDFSARGNARQQRYQLLKDLAEDKHRHILLLTATPHSGKAANFTSLLMLLDESFASLPSNLQGEQNRKNREKLAQHLVQRRRADIREYLSNLSGDAALSPFPRRLSQETTYAMNADYRQLMDEALEWARKTAGAYMAQERSFRSRVRWWSALALLRAISSSPAAAAATLEKRSEAEEQPDIEALDELGNTQVLDGDTEQTAALSDFAPAAISDAAFTPAESNQLRQMAKRALALRGERDPKMLQVLGHVEGLLNEGFRPVIFCRFIDTAEYLADELRKRLPGRLKAEIAAVTGRLAPEERLQRIDSLSRNSRYILVATDCLSEGINLQAYFDAVIHYDLSWNPTRHEQREGRADRFGQTSPEVKVITYYGRDNPVDGIVMSTLLRKHEQIKKALGISVPIPMDSNAVGEAIMESLLMRERRAEGEQMMFDVVLDMGEKLSDVWQDAADREKASRAIFAQNAISAQEVFDVWQRSMKAGGTDRLMDFLCAAFRLNNLPAGLTGTGALDVDLGSPEARRNGFDKASGMDRRVLLQPRFPAKKDEVYIMRTHPLVASLAEMVFTDALDKHPALKARRCGVVQTREVEQKTVVLLLRLRFLIRDYKGGRLINEKVAEDSILCAYQGEGESAYWLDNDEAHRLTALIPSGNVSPDLRDYWLERALNALPSHINKLTGLAENRASALQAEHISIRQAARLSGRTDVSWIRGSDEQPLDIVGMYVLLPAAGRV